MAQRKCSVVLTATAYRHCESLVDGGVYVTIDDAASDLIMQVRGGIQLSAPSIGPIQSQTSPISMSTAPVLASTPVIEAPIDVPKSAGSKLTDWMNS
jgi:hypothetical protein